MDKRAPSTEILPADKELKIRVLLELVNQFIVSESEAILDNQGPYHAKGLCLRSMSLAELSRVIILQLIPWNELSQLDPAIVTREFAAKWREKPSNEGL